MTVNAVAKYLSGYNGCFMYTAATYRIQPNLPSYEVGKLFGRSHSNWNEYSPGEIVIKLSEKEILDKNAVKLEIEIYSTILLSFRTKSQI